jgi:hypothetical protein
VAERIRKGLELAGTAQAGMTSGSRRADYRQAEALPSAGRTEEQSRRSGRLRVRPVQVTEAQQHE